MLNSLAAILDYAARIAVQFVINPLLVTALGTHLYGAWRVLWQLSGYLWATSGRSAQALQWVITKNQHSSDETEKRRYVASAVLVWLVFLPILAAVGGVGAWFAPRFLRVPSEYVSSVRVGGILLVADAIMLTLLTIPRAVLQGENLGYKRMGLSAILILLGGGLMVLAVRLDAGIVGVAAATLSSTVLTGLLFWHVAHRYVPWFGIARPQRHTVRWFLGLSGWFTVWKFVYEFMMAADVVILGLFGAVELVTVYTLTKAVPEALIVFLILHLLQGTGAGLGGIIGRRDIQKAIRVRNEIMALTWLISTVIGGSVMLWNRSFVGLWVGQEFYAGALPTLLIVLIAIQFLFVSNDARVIDMTLNVRAKVLTGVVSAGTSFALAAILVESSENKIVGLCIGVIAGRAILNVAYPHLVGRFLGIPLLHQLRGVLRPAVTTALLFALTLSLGERISTGSWLGLIALSGVTTALLALVAGWGGLSAVQRRGLRKRVRRVVARARPGSAASEPGRDVGHSA